MADHFAPFAEIANDHWQPYDWQPEATLPNQRDRSDDAAPNYSMEPPVRQDANEGTVDRLDLPSPEPSGDLTDWIFLSGDGEFFNQFTGERMSVSSFNLAMAPMTPDVEGTGPTGNATRKRYKPADTLVKYLGGKVASTTQYRPDIPVRHFWCFNIAYANSYLPLNVPPTVPDWRQHEAWQICDQHVRNILQDDADEIVRWMAHNVQHPGKKILWAPIVVGVQGDGKTTLMKILQAAMGAVNVSPVSPESMFSDFTGWAEGSAVNVLEEIRVHGNSRYDAMNKLKPLITNDTIEIVAKGKAGKIIPNVTNYMALTNHEDALALDDNDRRWGVFKTRFQSRKALLAETDRAYWTALHNAIDRHPSVIRGWLLAVDLSDFSRVEAPKTTAAKRRMIEATRSPAEAELAEAIECGGFGIAPDAVATDCLRQAIKAQGGLPLNSKALEAAMTKMGWVRYPVPVWWRARNRRTYYRQTPDIDGLADDALKAAIQRKLDATDTHGQGGF